MRIKAKAAPDPHTLVKLIEKFFDENPKFILTKVTYDNVVVQRSQFNFNVSYIAYIEYTHDKT